VKVDLSDTNDDKDSHGTTGDTLTNIENIEGSDYHDALNGSDVVVTWDGGSILLEGVDHTDLTEADFVF